MKFGFWTRLAALTLLICFCFTSALSSALRGSPMMSETLPAAGARAGATLVIDPGHGGEDGGAVSVTGTKESEINMAIAGKTRLLAALYGFPAVMTRESDDIGYPDGASTTRQRKVSDQKSRVALINSTENAVLISIHQNKYTSPKPSGPQVFYAPTEGSADFAAYMQGLLTGGLGGAGGRAAVRIPKTIYLMNSVKCPALLVECGFVSNEREAQLLEDGKYQTKLAALIAGGFVGYLAQSGGSDEG